MLWSTIFNKIGKQQMKFVNHNHAYALLHNSVTGELERVYLTLDYDRHGHPFFIEDTNVKEKHKC